jgi:manganese-transporting P-type ATPase
MIFNNSRDKKLIDVKETEKDTSLCLAAAHALVWLDDGTIVGDPMEKTTLEVLEWNLSKGKIHCKISTGPPLMFKQEMQSPHRTVLTICRRFQFSSALKRMSTVSSLPGGKTIAAVKGAPETEGCFLDGRATPQGTAF